MSDDEETAAPGQVDATSGGDVGEQLGAVVGAVLGRRLGGALGRALLPESLADELAPDEEGPNGDDAEGSESESETERPDSTEELEEMSYRELQSLAKAVGVTANLTREEMTERLVETLEIDGE